MIGIARKGLSGLPELEQTMRIRDFMIERISAHLHRSLCVITAVVLSTKKLQTMQLQNICTKKEYEKDGEKKTQWFKIGILKTAESGRKYIKLFHQPQTDFFVFDNDDQAQKEETGN